MAAAGGFSRPSRAYSIADIGGEEFARGALPMLSFIVTLTG
jgi:hypothetical protein